MICILFLDFVCFAILDIPAISISSLYFNCQLSAKSYLWGVVCKFLLPIVCLPFKSMDPPVLLLAPMDISSAVLRLLSAEQEELGVHK